MGSVRSAEFGEVAGEFGPIVADRTVMVKHGPSKFDKRTDHRL
jgi:hypothetical protein